MYEYHENIISSTRKNVYNVLNNKEHVINMA